MKRAALLVALLLAGPATAQEFSEAPGALLRWLDKLTGETGDFELQRGQSAVSGRLTILLDSCRYPTDNPASDATAHLTVMDSDLTEPSFAGWMLASSPALSALDHPRYDVWLLRCVLPEGAIPEAATPEASDE